jgi:hypothetical protein
MDVFLVERFVVGWSAEEIVALIRDLAAAEQVLTSYGVRHVESIVVAEDETVFSVMAGPDGATVRRANDACELPAHRVLKALTYQGPTP